LMTIWHWDATGNYSDTIYFEIPPIQESYTTYSAALIQANDNGFFLLISIRNVDPPYYLQALYRYSPNGDLLEQRLFTAAADDMNTYMIYEMLLLFQSSAGECWRYYEFDDQGRIYIPISDPEGFRVVRLTPLPAGG